MRYILSFFLLITISYSAYSQQLQLKNIMRGYDWVGHSPENIRWSADSKAFFFDWQTKNDSASQLYRCNVNTQAVIKATEHEQWLYSRRMTYNENKTARTFERDGDIYLDLLQGEPMRITQTSAYESSPHFSFDQKSIIFQKEKGLYEWNIKSGQIKQWVQFEKGRPKKSSKPTEQEAWIEKEEQKLLTIHERRATRRKLNTNKKSTEKNVAEIFVGKKHVFNIQLSPSKRYITYTLALPYSGKRTKMPDYVTKSGYTKTINARPKVGSGVRKFEFWIYDIKMQSSVPLKTEMLTGIYKKPDHFFLQQHDSTTNRANYVQGPIWSDNGEKALLEIRAIDNKDRWLVTLDLKTGKPTELFHHRDSAWIGGPGIGSYYMSNADIGWLPDNNHIYFRTEKSNWSHLNLLNTTTKTVRVITQGNWEVTNVQMSNDKKKWFLTTSKKDRGERHLYSMPLKGGEMSQLTSLAGNNQTSLSPNEKYIAIRNSQSNTPWEIFIKKNSSSAIAKQITSSTTQAFRDYTWRKPKIVKINARDGAQVPARLYLPNKEKANGAGIIFVHGAGYLQNAHKWWSSYYREYMFHNLLTDLGYTVLDIDYRASAGYGRDWRTAIYRHMGGKDLDDQVDGAKFLSKHHNVDAKRIGIYGGSYGGFITLMAMFKEADTFRAGAALRSVTDWAHYNHGYTMNILNTPSTDAKAYRRSSPIYFAEGLKGDLLILHGMVDNNVQFQDVVRLNQRLIELGKKNWNIALFPKEGHGFIESDSWYDEYRRILELFKRTLSSKNQSK